MGLKVHTFRRALWALSSFIRADLEAPPQEVIQYVNNDWHKAVYVDFTIAGLATCRKFLKIYINFRILLAIMLM